MMLRPTVRTITLGLADPHPIPARTIAWARDTLRQAQARYNAAGYEVQTLRLSTRPILDDLANWSPAALLSYVQELQRMLDDAEIGYCSLGTVFAADPAFSLERLEIVPDLLLAGEALSITVHLATVEHGLRFEVAPVIARIMRRLAYETAEGFGNFRFAMLACVAPGCPFFPAAYHAGSSSLSIGLQGAPLVSAGLRAAGADGGRVLNLTTITQTVRATLLEQAHPLVTLAEQLAQERGVRFGGIDLSPAPMAEESIVNALELCGYGSIGAPGTLAIAAALTEALKSVPLPTCGYNGLMLPVLEDAALGRRWEEGRITIHQLLLYSAVCGTGLDTIPLPGDDPVESIAHLLLDVAMLALRYQKPLSARLFPVPGKRAGEYTAFTSPYLSNTRLSPSNDGK